MFDLGDVWHLTQEAVGSVGNLTNATTVVLTITAPDGTITTPAVVNPPARTGLYRCDHTPSVAGRHAAHWSLTFSDGYTFVQSETLDVRPADPGGIVSVHAAKQHLNILNTKSDQELRGWIAAVTEVVEAKVGPCIIRSESTVITQAGGSWYLPKCPAIEVTSVTRIGTGPAIDTANLYLVPDTGEVIFVEGTSIASSSCGTFLITYTVGRSVIPANIVQAALIILKHLWETQRGTDITRGRQSLAGDDDMVLTPEMPWAVPRRAVELLQPHVRFPSVA